MRGGPETVASLTELTVRTADVTSARSAEAPAEPELAEAVGLVLSLDARSALVVWRAPANTAWSGLTDGPSITAPEQAAPRATR
jgi:hypothetical protein